MRSNPTELTSISGVPHDSSSTDAGEAEPHFSDIISFFFGLAHDPPPDFSGTIDHPW
jgi:hypothetical protein